MKPGGHGPAPMAFNLDAPHPPYSSVGLMAKLLRLLWESDSQLPRATETASVTPPPPRFHSVRILNLLSIYYGDIHDPNSVDILG